MSNKFYLYVSKETLQITGVSPVLDVDDYTSHAIQIDRELGISFIEAPHSFADYRIHFDGQFAHLIKLEKKNLITFSFTPIVIPIVEDHPNLQINAFSDQLDFMLNPTARGYVVDMYGIHDRSKQFAEFYVCAKNDPNKLIEIIKIDMIALAGGEVLVVQGNYDMDRVSLFTRKVLYSYGINIKQNRE